MSPDTPIDDPAVKVSRPFVRALQAAGITTLGAGGDPAKILAQIQDDTNKAAAR
jgi:hypothetical protein